MYGQLDRQKPYIGSTRALNLAEVKPVIFRYLSAISEWIKEKLRHNLLHKPALTKVIRISYVNIICCSKVTEFLWCPHRKNAISCVSAGTLMLNYGATNKAPTQKD
jgi:hypothetical protein